MIDTMEQPRGYVFREIRAALRAAGDMSFRKLSDEKNPGNVIAALRVMQADGDVEEVGGRWRLISH